MIAQTLRRATDTIHRHVVAEGAFLLAAAPGFAIVVLLDRSPGNLPLYALGLVPLGPAFSGIVSTLAHPDDDLAPWRRYWHSYRQNVGDVLRVWIPVLAVCVVLGSNIAFGAEAGVDGFFLAASSLLLAATALFSCHAIVLASLFRFRTRDTARLALYYLAARPLATLGALSFLVLGMAVIALVSDWAFALLASVLGALLVSSSRSMVGDATTRFTPEGADQ